MSTYKRPGDPYDVVAVLCGGLRQVGYNDYAPTTFSDSDEFGMLGGDVRITAAAWLYESGACKNFLFSTGVSAKQIEKFGPDVPAEALVYQDAFLKQIAQMRSTSSRDNAPVETFIEDQSVNTVGNLEGIAQICIDNGWQKVGIISSAYHIPRIRALLTLLMKQSNAKIRFEFLLAEPILRAAYPKKYDAEFDEAYGSLEGQKRLANEKKGQQDIEEGKYVFTEFQLTIRENPPRT